MRTQESTEGDRLYLLNTDQVDVYWGHIAQVLDAAQGLLGKGLSPADIRQQIEFGHVQVWALSSEGAIRLIVMTSILTLPRTKILQAFLGFGRESKGAYALVEGTLERFAMTQGCEWMEVVGRKGWERVLRPMGYEFEHITLSKRVGQERTH